MRNKKTLRHAHRVSYALSWRGVDFLRDLVLNREVGSYRTMEGRPIQLRPRKDLRIASEFMDFGWYAPPEPLASLHDEPLRILDIGGHIGLFALAAKLLYQFESFTTIESDPQNLSLLRANLDSNSLGHVEIITAELGVDDLLSAMDGADLVKIDIGGGEWPILRSPGLADLRTGAIVMKWYAGEADGLGTSHEADSLLRAAGYKTLFETPMDAPSGLAWAWREPAT